MSTPPSSPDTVAPLDELLRHLAYLMNAHVVMQGAASEADIDALIVRAKRERAPAEAPSSFAKRIVDTGPKARLVDPEVAREALGAEQPAESAPMSEWRDHDVDHTGDCVPECRRCAWKRQQREAAMCEHDYDMPGPIGICRKCGELVRKPLPFTAGDIAAAEVRAYGKALVVIEEEMQMLSEELQEFAITVEAGWKMNAKIRALIDAAEGGGSPIEKGKS